MLERVLISEVGSYVPARLLPQMAEVAEVLRHALNKPGLTLGFSDADGRAPSPSAVGPA